MAVKIINPPPPEFTPMNVYLPVKLRAGMVQALQELAPPGSPNPVLVQTARTAALALVESLDPDVNGAEVRLECNNGTAKQIMVIVIPHKL